VLIPCLDDDRFVLQNYLPNLVEFTRAEPIIPREFDGHQPELAVLSIAPNVDGRCPGVPALRRAKKKNALTGEAERDRPSQFSPK